MDGFLKLRRVLIGLPSLSVANLTLVFPIPKFDPAPPVYESNTSFPGVFKLYPLT